MNVRRNIVLGIATVVTLMVLWFIRPIWHGIFMFVHANPLLYLVLVGAIGVGIGNAFVFANKDSDPLNVIFSYFAGWGLGLGTFIGGIVVLGILYAPFTTILPQLAIVNQVEVGSTNKLPRMDAKRPRILPMSVAKRHASSSLQYSKYQLAKPDITLIDGRPSWSFPLVPDGMVNSFRLNGKGGAFVFMDKKRKDIKTIESEQAVGPGQLIMDHIYWSLTKGNFLVRYTEYVPVPDSDNVHFMVPMIEYDLQFSNFLIPYTVPKFGGTALVKTDGSIKYLSPEEARKHPALENQRLYPFDLAYYYVNSYRYKLGVMNTFFYHDEQFEIAGLPGQGNDQPFLVLTKDGIEYVVAAEPYGNAQGIYKVFVIGARTGKIKRFKLDKNDALLGPDRAAQYIQKKLPKYNWSNLTLSEPLPYIREDGKFLWQIRIVPENSSGIASVAFVDAKDGTLENFSRMCAIRAFMADKKADTVCSDNEANAGALSTQTSATNGQPTSAASASENGVTLIIEGENGQAQETIRLEDGSTIRIEKSP